MYCLIMTLNYEVFQIKCMAKHSVNENFAFTEVGKIFTYIVT